MRWLLPRTLALAALGSSACGQGPDSLEVYFTDELVEAPARSVQLVAQTGVGCDAVLSATHDASVPGAVVLLRTTTAYPVNPALALLEGLPRSTPLALSVAVYDGAQGLIARACEVVRLEPGQPAALRVRAHALPQCPDVPVRALDLMLVLDTSLAMSVADTEANHITQLHAKVLDGVPLVSGSTWSIVAHGHTTARQVLAPSGALDEVKAAVDALAGEHSGVPAIYDAMYTATALLRARAVCGRKPVILALLGGYDESKERVLDDAIVGVVGERGDATDDVYAYGIGVNTAAYDTLSDIVPEGVGVVAGAGNGVRMRMVMSEAALQFNAFVSPP